MATARPLLPQSTAEHDAVSILHIDRLSKTLGGRTVLRQLTMRLDRGSYALVGSNGAGKSTLLKILAGAEPADEGRVVIAGHDLARQPMAARRALSFVPDKLDLPLFLSAREFILAICRVKGLRDLDAVFLLAERFGLAGLLDSPAGKLSFGSQRKVLMTIALSGQPQLLLIDECTNGLDQASLQVLAERLRQLAADAVVLFSSHEPGFIATANARRIDVHGRFLLADTP